MRARTTVLLPGLAVFVLPSQALAYVGPGVGVGAIMATLAVLLGVILLAVGFLWYPIKRVLRGGKAEGEKVTSSTD